jgi:hypothetical protein
MDYQTGNRFCIVQFCKFRIAGRLEGSNVGHGATVRPIHPAPIDLSHWGYHPLLFVVFLLELVQ